MTHIVTEPCIKCKFMDCVDICPVDCFFEGANMVVIDPDQCIDCGLCIPYCPVDAIKPDTADETQPWVLFNRMYAKKWPKIVNKKPEPSDAEQWVGVASKKDLFDPSPGNQ